MKRFLALILIALLLILSGCGSSGYSPERNSDYITLGTYKGLTHQMADCTVTDYALTIASNQKLLENGYADTETSLSLTEGTVQIGDTVYLTYTGTVDGEAFDGNEGEGTIMIGEGALIPGFEEGLIGTQIGETIRLDLTFPRDYSDSALAGKAVTYEVNTSKIVGRITYATLTDEIATNLGYDSLADYQQALKEEVSADLSKKAEQEKVSMLWTQVLSNSTIEEPLPEELLESARADWSRRYTAAANQLAYDTIADYLAANHLGEYSAVINRETTATVRNLLAARAIAEAEGFELTDDIIEKETAAYAAKAGYKSTEKYVKDIGESMIEYQILLDYAQKIVVDNAIIK